MDIKTFLADSICLPFFCVTTIGRLPRGPTRTHQILKFWLTFKREFKREMMFVGKTHKRSFFSRSPTIFPSGWNERFLRPVLDAFTCLFILYQNFNSLPQKLLTNQDKRLLLVTKRFYLLFTSNFVLLLIFHFFTNKKKNWGKKLGQKIEAKNWGKKRNFVFSQKNKKI